MDLLVTEMSQVTITFCPQQAQVASSYDAEQRLREAIQETTRRILRRRPTRRACQSIGRELEPAQQSHRSVHERAP